MGKILAPKLSKDKNVAGPSCILDAEKKLLTISGRIELFGFSTDGYVEATPTKIKEAGMRANNDAKKTLTDAQAVFDNVAGKIASKRSAVTSAQNKVNGICSGEEQELLAVEDFTDLLKDTPKMPA